jgi:HTH-type transcriptional regulator/antitoxin HigA
MVTMMKDDYLYLTQRLPLAPIRNRRQLREAHAMIDEMTRIPENKLTPGQADDLEVLGDLTLKFERPQMAHELEKISGLDLLKHLLEENDMNASDLGRLLGQRELGSKLLRGDRQISRSHAKRLGERFGLPAETFLR